MTDSSPARVGDPNPGNTLDPQIASMLKRDPAGLVPAVVQDQRTRDVLMLGWMDDRALHQTLTSGRSTFYSRSRGEYWVKGETSGHRQWVREVRLDCDGDTLLVLVEQEGAACHTGDRTCFDARLLPVVVAAGSAAAVSAAAVSAAAVSAAAVSAAAVSAAVGSGAVGSGAAR